MANEEVNPIRIRIKRSRYIGRIVSFGILFLFVMILIFVPPTDSDPVNRFYCCLGAFFLPIFILAFLISIVHLGMSTVTIHPDGIEVPSGTQENGSFDLHFRKKLDFLEIREVREDGSFLKLHMADGRVHRIPMEQYRSEDQGEIFKALRRVGLVE